MRVDMMTSLKSIAARQAGVTGLETAIIVISFVVVASVFAFTILSTGIFSAERGRETVFAGHAQASGSVELKGSVVANGVVSTILSDAETLWTEVPANASAAQDSIDKKVGSYSTELTVGATQTGLLAYYIISPSVDISSLDSVSLWVKPSLLTPSARLQLRVSDDGSSCGTGGNYEDINLPALTAGSWSMVTVGITDSTTRTAVACVGLVANTSYSATATINVDEITALGQVTSLVVLVANSVKGEPVNLREPSDSDGDGTADSEDRSHQLIVTYTDVDQIKNDLYWTKSFIGSNDGDNLIEEGERAEITIQLEALNQASPLINNKQFGIELKPLDGSVLSVQRITPDNIDLVMNLK